MLRLTIVTARNARAALAGLCFVEKLLRMFPSVWSTKLQYPPSARIIPIASAMDTDHLVTYVHRSTPLLAMLRYTRNDECWHTKANDIAPKPAKIVGRTKTSLSDRSISGTSLAARPAFERQGNGKQHSNQGYGNGKGQGNVRCNSFTGAK